MTLFCDDTLNLARENIFGECEFDESEEVNDGVVLNCANCMVSTIS